MLEKKAQLISILGEIENDWPIAKGLILLINRTNTTIYQIEFLLDLFSNLLKDTKDKIALLKLTESISRLNYLKNMEQDEYEDEQKELDLIFNNI